MPPETVRTAVLEIVDGVRVVVPDSLDLITPYVLREQHDWFEDEIKFLRRSLQPGQRVIDIGANYGVYTLSLARVVGPTGHVWAFEPATSTADLLAEGIAANGFAHVTLERCALSDASGVAQLALNANSELNALIHDPSAASESETVALATLDDLLATHDWGKIDFVKIDAEGEEANIIKGGRQFFAERSPLVQYEIKAGDSIHLDLVKAFAAIGYKSYRLVPGLDVLTPFNADLAPDPYLLNLFCCKPDCASRLAAQGYLVDPSITPSPKGWKRWFPFGGTTKDRDAQAWRYLLKLPYGALLAPVWEQTIAASSGEVEKGLSQYALSRDKSLSSEDRLAALESAFDQFMTLCKRAPSRLRLASLARMARDYGARSVAVTSLMRLNEMIARERRVDPSEPFLAPGKRFDSIPPGKSMGDWMRAAVLEELERLASYSSFYSGRSAWDHLEMIRTFNFGDDEMERRRHLIQQRFGIP